MVSCHARKYFIGMPFALIIVKKWKSTIENLSIVINNEEYSQDQRDHCKKLLAKAQSYRDQQLEKRSNFCGGLFMTAASVEVAYMNAKSDVKGTSDPSV